MNKVNKRYIILFVGVIVLLLIFVGIVYFQSGQQQTPATVSSSVHQQTAGSDYSPNNSNQPTETPAPTLALPPLSTSAKAAAKQFYLYYFSSQSNPLAHGAYKRNPYLSDDFKNVIGILYENGNVPVFCPQNKRQSVTVVGEQTVYYNNMYLTQEVISDAVNGKELYRILLESQNSEWYIFDINCIS